VNARTDDAFIARTWLVEDGLPNDACTQIVQTHDGFLWLASSSGLARFDGREFKEYPLPMASPETSANIRDLVVEEDNALVMLPASGGVVRFRGGEFSMHPVTPLLTGQVLVDLFAEKNGVLWVGTEGGQVARWEKGQLQTFGRADGIFRRGIRFSFARDAQDRTWVGGYDFLGYYENGRLHRFEAELHEYVVVAPSRDGGIWISAREGLSKIHDRQLALVSDAAHWNPAASGGVQVLHEDSAGALWVGTRRQGLFRFTGEAPVSIPDSHRIIKALFEDPEQNLWVATEGGGLSRLRPKVFTMVDASIGLPDDISSSVCEDANGVLWSANRSGGVVRIKAGKMERILPRVGRVPYAIAICPDQSGTIWVGASDALYCVPPGDRAEVQLVAREQRDAHVLFGASNGDMWVATFDEGLGYYRSGIFHAITDAEGHPHHRTKAIAEDAQHHVWIATDNRQLFEFANGRFELRVAREQMPGGVIAGLYFDAADNLWITTARGLVLKQGERLFLFTTEHGLPESDLAQVLEDERGRVWCSSRRGMFSCVKEDLLACAAGRVAQVNATRIGSAEGLHGASALNTTQPLAWRGRDRTLWFATHSGIVGIDPTAALPSRPAPQVFIDTVLFDRQPVKLFDRLPVPAGVREMEFALVALNYAAPEMIRVQHQLVGFDFDWVETGADRLASYARVPPGDYQLRVRARNSDGPWDTAGVTLGITVLPAWWQTWWCQGGLVLIFTGLVVWGARYWSHRRLKTRLDRLEREHALEKERARIARDLHDDLGGSLTQIGMLADRLNRQADSPRMKEALNQLAGRTRNLAGELESIVWTVSPKNNTWDRLASFIALFAQRFFRDTAIECAVEGTETIPRVALAPEVQHHVLAIVKEAMNNVLKHSRATKVKLTMKFAAENFELRLWDNGVGFDPAASEHAERNGLANMRSRAAEVGGSLEIASDRVAGTQLVIRIPQAATIANPRS
jgi:signal transduction histidine kinase/ligand-binding sensor domain-containing protein